MNEIKQKLFPNLDFKTLSSNADFKEDSVRAVIIDPLLKELGYGQDDIVRSKTVHLKVGSGQKTITLIPDYSLKVGENYSFVLDAKAPNQKVLGEDNINQAYSYAVNPEIKSAYFALCNGLEFVLFKTAEFGMSDASKKPILYFELEEIDKFFEVLKKYLSPDSFHRGKEIIYPIASPDTEKDDDFDYLNRPLLGEIIVKKQAAKRHYGVHGYFTKQSWNVVAAYIKNFTKKGDLVLDPFGGSGVTAIEALMNGRKAINIDINPMAIFIVEALLAPVKIAELEKAFDEVKEEYLKKEPKTKTAAESALKKYPKPKKLILPKGSDVPTVDQLFTKKQTAQLALLKSIIKKQKNKNIRNSLLLMFSGLVSRANLTCHGTRKRSKDVDGIPSVFRYSRYRLAPDPIDIDIKKFFVLRLKKICAAKKEMEYFINEQTIKNIQICKGTATNLSFIGNETVDYIYTDPPYGKNIAYLDLSVMWNAWLDLEVSKKDYEEEAIEGGKYNKSKEEYKSSITRSIKEMYRVLKFDRWLSFVFAHKDPEFWHLIINSAESCGFEYVGAVAQKNGSSHFKKKQNPFTVLSGELIINFKKTRNPKAIMMANLGMNISEIVTQTIEGVIAKNNGATIEQINDELIIKGLELGFLHLLKKEYSDLKPVLAGNFDYDEKSGVYHLRADTKFKANKIDINLRIKYYLVSYLRGMGRENKEPDFNEIVFNIMPLLKNGITPENQTILKVLESIADRTENDGWHLKTNGQQEMF